MKKYLIIEPHYLPSVEYFAVMNKYQRVFLDYGNPYQRQTYRNRTYILTSQGDQILSVPTQKIDNQGIIDYSTGWQRQHINALKTAYGKSPYFDYYKDCIFYIIESHYTSLYDLSRDLVINICKELSIEIYISTTQIDNIDLLDVDNLSDRIHLKDSYIQRGFLSPRPYRQVFGNEFVPNMSIVDLIFCVGPESINYIQ